MQGYRATQRVHTSASSSVRGSSYTLRMGFLPREPCLSQGRASVNESFPSPLLANHVRSVLCSLERFSSAGKMETARL